jgi:hypothetical protein
MRPMMRPMFFLQKFQYPLTNWQFPPIFHGQISYCFNQEIMWRKKNDSIWTNNRKNHVWREENIHLPAILKIRNIFWTIPILTHL